MNNKIKEQGEIIHMEDLNFQPKLYFKFQSNNSEQH